MRVIDAMTEDVATVAPDAPVKQAAAEMLKRNISGLPVVDADGRLVGIITEGDFLQLEQAAPRGDDFYPHPTAQILSSDRPLTVEDAMTRRVITTSPETQLVSAARSMAEHDVKRLPVVDPDGRVLGILSRADVMAVFTRPDELIAEEINEEIVRRVLMEDPGTLEVVVKDGNVHLTGSLHSRSDARLLGWLVRRLEGVISVDNDVEWRFDDTRHRVE